MRTAFALALTVFSIVYSEGTLTDALIFCFAVGTLTAFLQDISDLLTTPKEKK